MSNDKSVIHRVALILRLFREDKPLISIEEIAAAIEVSGASAYRYAAEMVDAGLLSRLYGRYRVGVKIIELEYLAGASDPVISTAHDLMDALARECDANVLLCNMYDRTLVNVLHVTGQRPISVRYTKGRAMPLFRGSQARVVLAYMERRRLQRLYQAAVSDPEHRQDLAELGPDWTAFMNALRQVRKQGFYVSRGELDSGVTGIAAPVFGENQEVLGSIVMVLDEAHITPQREACLIDQTCKTAHTLSERVARIFQSA